LKRTRRVEVVRYSQRVTQIQGASAAGVIADEQQAGGLVMKLLEGRAPVPEQVNCELPGPDAGVTEHPRLQRSLVKVGNLLGLRRQ